MTRPLTNTFAAFAAVLIAMTSISAIVTVPPASAQSVSPVVELA